MTIHSIDAEPPPDQGAYQGPAGWARRGAAGMGILPGESLPDDSVPAMGGTGVPATAEDADPDISPSLAGGHAGGSHRDPD